MKIKTLRRLFVAAFVAQALPRESDAAALIMMLEVVNATNQNQPTDTVMFMQRFKLKNLDSGRTYKSTATRQNDVAVFDVPEGSYCLHSINPYSNMELEYCKAPFFRVQDGKVNNAGKWRFGYSFDTHTLSRVYALKDPQAVIDRARQTDAGLFKD